jgi:hypothetical protein
MAKDFFVSCAQAKTACRVTTVPNCSSWRRTRTTWRRCSRLPSIGLPPLLPKTHADSSVSF